MYILVRIAATFAFTFGIIALYLPGGFGIMHFCRDRSRFTRRIVTTLWIVLMLVHVLAICRTWFSHDSIVVWIVALFLAQVVFFSTVARNVSTQ